MSEKNLGKGVTMTPANRFPEGYEALSSREKKYFKMMNSKSGVLFITSAPGYAKSAIMRSIAGKIGYQYFDIRLSMIDETDVGLYPSLDEEVIDGVSQRMLAHVAPKWAYKANDKPTIIHFEELNRSTLAVRNAALQILLEREIGAFFAFNSNVLMCSSGNLGEEDGTDVEEFDQALNNRLIHIEHTMPFPEWVDQYASKNVAPVIVQFLKTHTEHYYKKPDQRNTTNKTNKAYATPRSWTFLSDYIFENHGEYVEKTDISGNVVKDAGGKTVMIKKFPNIRVWIDEIKEIGHGYIGASNAPFVRYCEDTLRITLDDVLDRFDDILDDVKNFNRDKKSELLANMKERSVSVLKPKQLENLVKFLGTISDDEVIGYLLHVLDTEYTLSEDSKPNKTTEKFLADKRFNKFRDTIFKHVDDDDDKK